MYKQFNVTFLTEVINQYYFFQKFWGRPVENTVDRSEESGERFIREAHNNSGTRQGIIGILALVTSGVKHKNIQYIICDTNLSVMHIMTVVRIRAFQGYWCWLHLM